MSDCDLMVTVKLKEAFKVDLDLEKLRSKNICDWCLGSLETSYTFYQQVIGAQQSMDLDIKDEIDVSNLVNWL